MAFWEIGGGSVTRQAAELLGITIVSGNFKSLASDEVVLQIAKETSLTATTLWAYKARVTIWRDDVKWFQGFVTKLPRQGSGRGESQGYTLSGPMWYLDNLVYQETWRHLEQPTPETPAVDVLTGRVLIGMDEAGDRIATGAQLTAILTWAAAAGVPLTVGTILTGWQVWPSEIKDRTVGQIVRQILKWHPDAVMWWDYSTTDPTVHIQQRADLTAWDVDLADEDAVTDLSITPRPDLVLPACKLVWEWTHTADEDTYTTSEVEIWPALATGLEIGALVMTIPLQGSTTQKVAQRIRTGEYPYPGDETVEDPMDAGQVASREDCVKWWLSKLGLTADQIALVDLTKIEISSHLITYRDPALAPAHPAPVNPDAVPVGPPTIGNPWEDFPRELLTPGGGLEEWTGRQATRLGATATMRVDAAWFDGLIAPEDAPIKLFFGNLCAPGRDPDDDPYEATLSQEFTGTDATTKTYRGIQNYEPPEDRPTGIAQAVVESTEPLNYEGSFTWTEIEADGSGWLGSTLNLLSGVTAWSTMAALVQSVSVNLADGTTRVSFGPPGHLGVQDFRELLAAKREQGTTSMSKEEREDGKLGSGIVGAGYEAERDKTMPTKATFWDHPFCCRPFPAVSPDAAGIYVQGGGYWIGSDDPAASFTWVPVAPATVGMDAVVYLEITRTATAWTSSHVISVGAAVPAWTSTTGYFLIAEIDAAVPKVTRQRLGSAFILPPVVEPLESGGLETGTDVEVLTDVTLFAGVYYKAFATISVENHRLVVRDRRTETLDCCCDCPPTSGGGSSAVVSGEDCCLGLALTRSDTTLVDASTATGWIDNSTPWINPGYIPPAGCDGSFDFTVIGTDIIVSPSSFTLLMGDRQNLTFTAATGTLAGKSVTLQGICSPGSPHNSELVYTF
jgi:hypothetical protein